MVFKEKLGVGQMPLNSFRVRLTWQFLKTCLDLGQTPDAVEKLVFRQGALKTSQNPLGMVH